MLRKFSLYSLLLVLVVPAAAQKNEIAVLGGGHFPVNDRFDTGVGPAVQFNYARRVASVPLVSLYLEFPLAASFDFDLDDPGLGVPGNFNSVFFTPALKLKLAPGFPASPFFSAGGGVARFRERTTDSTETTSVFQFGGGLDIKIFPYLSLRGEVRDFYSGSPRLTLEDIDERQHNVLVSGGIVLRW